MNAFGEALNLVFMRWSWWFSSGSMPMDSISDCIPMSSYSQANESQTAFPWVPVLFPSQWISDCIPMSSYLPAKFLESFGWVPPMSCHPDSGMPLGFHQMRPERDFGGTPYNHTWVPIKSIVERFRRLLRDFRFWANFSIFSSRKNLDLRRLSAYQRKKAIGPQSNRLKWSSRMGLEWQITA